MVEFFAQSPILSLFLIIALGTALGSLSVSNLNLGTSAVLFVALGFGHLGIMVPSQVQDLGLVLFVYAVGLQAGPRFFHLFRARGISFAQIGIAVVLGGAVLTILTARLFGISPGLALGLYAGAMTSTPALAAGMDALGGDPSASVGYGIAYPFGVIGVVLFVQLLPRLLRVDLREEERKVRESQPPGRRIHRRIFAVSNPACSGRSLLELKLHRLIEVNISRIRREGRVLAVKPETRLQLGDMVVAVGRMEDLDKLRIVFGEETQEEDIFNTQDVIARDALVTNPRMAGKSLSRLGVFEEYGVVVTRVFREDMEFVPTGSFILEDGDLIRITGAKEDCDRFIVEIGQQEKSIHETNILALSLGIFGGLLLGIIELPLPGGASFRLGTAGGPLLVSLLLAHYGRVGKLNIRIPRGAKYIMSQLGLVLFLAGAGTAAGRSFVEVLAASGLQLLAAGVVVTLGASLIGLALSRFVFKLDLLTVLGLICGAMTSTPALGTLSDLTDSRQPLLSYAAVYPVAMILITLTAQFLVLLL